MSDRKYFGTDGTHGRVGGAPITPDFMLGPGQAAGRVLVYHDSRRIIIGKDIRISGHILESALGVDLAVAGLSAFFIGPVPIPVVVYLMRTFHAEVGIVISAPHDPFYNNGVRFLSIGGTRLPDAVEKAIETETEEEINYIDSTELGETSRIVNAMGHYIEFCRATFPNELNLSELKIAVDCVNSATYCTAPNMLRELGVDTVATGCGPNGVDIDAEVRTTDVRTLQARVLAEKTDLGITFDDDGDRVVMVGHEGSKVDDNQTMYIITCGGLCRGQLHSGTVGTLVSSIGLELALKQLRVPFACARVSDRYVLEKIQERGWHIGTKNSGHMVLLDKIATGNDIIAGLQVPAAMVCNHVSLHDFCSGMRMLPQILVSVRYAADNGGSPEHKPVKAATAGAEVVLGNRGRILLRKSGTESLTRTTVEDEDEAQTTESAHRTTDAVKAVQSVR